MTTETLGGSSADPVLTLSDEQQDLATTLSRLLQSSWQPRLLIDGDPITGPRAQNFWYELDKATGIAGLTVPQSSEGAGAGVIELSVIAEQLGGALHPAPWLAVSGLAVPLLCSGDSNTARAAMLQAIATAAKVVTVASTGGEVVCGRDDTGAVRVSGRLPNVVDADAADWVLVPAEVDDRYRLLGVELQKPGATRRRLTTLDLARTHADVELDAAPALDLGAVAAADIEHTLNVARVSAAAELVGVAAGALNLAVEYAKQRTQFGRVIGSYQAVKHRCARMLIDVEQARSMLRHAAWCADHDTDRLTLAACEAYWFGGRVAVQVSADLIRVLGGTGFTWEHEAHLYFRRARATAMLFGDPLSCLDEVARRILP